MKRLLAVILALSVAACGSQQRPDDEPDFSPEPYSPNETPEPRLGEIESLISQARLEIKRRDYDEARVKLHQVFRRDRWHPEANTLYQDLQISRGKGDALYQEYLDLYEANKQRGDALWFHLRPLLIKRGIKACEVERVQEPSEAVQDRVREIKVALNVGPGRSTVPPKELSESERLALVEEWLKLDPWEGTAVRELANLRPKETLERYREAAEESAASGNAQWIYAKAVQFTSGEDGDFKALDILRRAWILELPGTMITTGIASLSLVNAYRWLPVSKERLPTATELYGFLELALHFYRISDLTEPDRGYGEMIAGRVLQEAKDNSIVLEDLSNRK